LSRLKSSAPDGVDASAKSSSRQVDAPENTGASAASTSGGRPVDAPESARASAAAGGGRPVDAPDRVLSGDELASHLFTNQRRIPLDQDSLIIDNNLASAIQKLKHDPQSLNPNERAFLNQIDALGESDLRLTDTTVGEAARFVDSTLNGVLGKQVQDLGQLNHGTVLEAGPDSQIFNSILNQLENVRVSRRQTQMVGGANGINDRKIVAEAFLSEGTQRTLLTADAGVFRLLARLAGIRDVNARGLVESGGFSVTLENRTLRVVPIGGAN
jgi:hypothetical protein